ncbi:hypothetical protein BDZ85DRAFT_267741 [Elsinoe ampelina]|uniref:Uncharacterized protein n=1 Tax=Elsinoe ampelina TaxID=302913 RepID=A0A6A6G2C9_9PEZI|nr:hypothetical protein BDZ85DRAFT_267741 [Elsinoe ampelina]
MPRILCLLQLCTSHPMHLLLHHECQRAYSLHFPLVSLWSGNLLMYESCRCRNCQIHPLVTRVLVRCLLLLHCFCTIGWVKGLSSAENHASLSLQHQPSPSIYKYRCNIFSLACSGFLGRSRTQSTY